MNDKIRRENKHRRLVFGAIIVSVFSFYGADKSLVSQHENRDASLSEVEKYCGLQAQQSVFYQRNEHFGSLIWQLQKDYAESSQYYWNGIALSHWDTSKTIWQYPKTEEFLLISHALCQGQLILFGVLLERQETEGSEVILVAEHNNCTNYVDATSKARELGYASGAIFVTSFQEGKGLLFAMPYVENKQRQHILVSDFDRQCSFSVPYSTSKFLQNIAYRPGGRDLVLLFGDQTIERIQIGAFGFSAQRD